MSLPNSFRVKIRSALGEYARPQRCSSTRNFSAAPQRYREGPPAPKSGSKQRQWPYNGALTPQKSIGNQTGQSNDSRKQKNETELVPQHKEQTALDTDRRVPVPMRAIPKAQLTPNLKLSPRERLHIEVLTRQQPRQQEKKIYRERLQIYHMGSLKENVLSVLRVSGITGACLVTFIIMPAHLTAGTSLWAVGLIWLAGFVPLYAINYSTKGMITRIFLNLPTKARETSKAAMEYAKNLPGDADLDIRYLKPWALEASVKAKLSQFEPTQSNYFRPLTFKWKDKWLKSRSGSRFSPSSFYVSPQTASGESSRDTIPGIWESVYKKLMSKGQDPHAVKWEKPRSGSYIR